MGFPNILIDDDNGVIGKLFNLSANVPELKVSGAYTRVLLVCFLIKCQEPKRRGKQKPLPKPRPFGYFAIVRFNSASTPAIVGDFKPLKSYFLSFV